MNSFPVHVIGTQTKRTGRNADNIKGMPTRHTFSLRKSHVIAPFPIPLHSFMYGSSSSHRFSTCVSHETAGKMRIYMSWSFLQHTLLTSRLKYCTGFEALHSFGIDRRIPDGV